MKQVPPFFVPIPKSSDSRSNVKLWDLKYRGVAIPGCTGKAYPICRAKQNELIKGGGYGEIHFLITKSEQ